MARSDFNVVNIQHKFTVNSPTVTRQFPIEGNQPPIDDGYLLFFARGVSLGTHRIRINNVDLPGLDIPPTSGNSQVWMLAMDHIPPNTLKTGTNSITFTRSGNDDFEIAGVVVNWRERG